MEMVLRGIDFVIVPMTSEVELEKLCLVDYQIVGCSIFYGRNQEHIVFVVRFFEEKNIFTLNL